MFRIILFLLAIAAIATGLSWLADRPGSLVINWQDYQIETSVFRAVVIFSVLLAFLLFAWSLLRNLISTPAAIGQFVNRRRQKKGLDALSTGMIAIGAGDETAATHYAMQARRSLPNEPMTQLLRAQAAQLSGDKATARRIYEAMLATPDTEQLALRGLFLEAEREGETVAARHFAERAAKLNPKLGWAIDGLFSLQCKESDWEGALETVSIARRNGHIEKTTANRRRAVLLTAQAQVLEDDDQEKALQLATEAHGLAPELVPAGAIAGRIQAAKGNTPKATKIIYKTWSKSPHPDLATAYAYARLGDSPRDRLDRVKKLTSGNPYSLETPIAVASAALEAKDIDEARRALEPLLDGRATQRVCTLMARIESEEGNTGRVREWLARAVTAVRDPAWTADGVVSNSWQPISPVSGALDAFQWRVPVEAEKSDNDLLAKKIEELVALASPEKTIEAQEIPAQAQARKANSGETDNSVTRSTKTAAFSTTSSRGSSVISGRARTTPAQMGKTIPAGGEAASSENTQSNGSQTTEPQAFYVAVDPAAAPQSDTPDAAVAKDPTEHRGDDRSNTKIFVSPRAPDDPGPKKPKSQSVKRDPANPYRRVTS